MLRVFSIDVYVLFDRGATLSFVTPLISRTFDILPNTLNEPFMVSNLVGELVIAKRVCKNCPIMLPNTISRTLYG